MSMLTSMNEIDIAWAAGFFDGEGCISFRPNNGGKNPFIRISINQNADNREVLDKFIRIVGVGKVYGPYGRGRNKDVCSMYVGKYEHTQYIIALLWKHMSTCKRVQAKQAILRYKQFTPDNSARAYVEDVDLDPDVY
jgi:hypothetical protein